MKIRLIGFLTKSQIEESMAQVDKIVAEKGTVHIKKGMTFTHTFKKDKAVGVTIRRAPNFKFLSDEDQVVKPEEVVEPKVAPEHKESTELKVGDIVKVKYANEVDVREHPLYVKEMEQYGGLEFMVARLYAGGRVVSLEAISESSYFTDVSDWTWNEKWLTLVSRDA